MPPGEGVEAPPKLIAEGAGDDAGGSCNTRTVGARGGGGKLCSAGEAAGDDAMYEPGGGSAGGPSARGIVVIIAAGECGCPWPISRRRSCSTARMSSAHEWWEEDSFARKRSLRPEDDPISMEPFSSVMIVVGASCM